MELKAMNTLASIAINRSEWGALIAAGVAGRLI